MSNTEQIMADPGEPSRAPDSLMRPDEAAAMLRLSKQRLAEMRLEGSGPDFIKAGRSVLYSHGDVMAWVQKNRRRSTSDTAA